MTVDLDLIVFDLDGTLVDSLPDLAAAANHALRRLGLPEHPPEAHQKDDRRRGKNLMCGGFWGRSTRTRLTRPWPCTWSITPGHLGDQSRALHPGVTATLATLRPLKMAVLSNKRGPPHPAGGGDHGPGRVFSGGAGRGTATACSSPRPRALSASSKNWAVSRPEAVWWGISPRTS